jgi:SepF-like predicted cell division protein (DUF552 family)
MVLTKLKRMLGKGDENSSDYIEIDLESQKPESTKVLIKTFTLKAYEDINPILNHLREGYTIAMVDIKPLKSKDVVELKRAIAKIKKTVEALEGNIAGFGENTVIAAPPFVKIQKGDFVEAKPSFRDELERY